jgi:high-affinity iron transporter
MFQLATVIFRECLEISLLLAIILAVTKSVDNSRFFVVLGAIIGVILSAFVAMGANFITQYFSYLGDEILDSIIILSTAILINWTVIWMQGYNHKIKNHFSQISKDITAGIASKLTIVLVVASTILREGIEIILFVYSIVSVGKLPVNDYLIGLFAGMSFGFLSGYVIYKGLIQYAGKYIFQISTILLTFVAAGLAAEGAGILTSCGLVEFGSNILWDSSYFVNNNSMVGKVLKIIIGYDARPNLLQIIFYLASIAMTLLFMQLRRYKK